MNKLYDLFLQSSGVSIDSRSIFNGCLFFALKGENFNGNDFALNAISKGAIAAVVDEPNLKNAENCFFVQDVLTALTEISKIHRSKLNCPVLAITGSNGKTTTKELISSVLLKKFNLSFTKGNFNNHIGVPLTLLSTPLDAEFLVIEMGANHIGEIDYLCKIANPDYGIITNIGKAHLEGFGSPEGVFIGKTELYRHVITFGKGLFVNADDSLLMSATNNCIVCSYGSAKADVFGEVVNLNPFLDVFCKVNNHEMLIKTNLFGSYNSSNVLAAVAIGYYFGIPLDDINSAISSYLPNNNRSQTIKSKKNNHIILDAYNANPSSMKLALQDFAKDSLQDKLVIIGSMLEMGEYSKDEHLAILNLLKDLKIDKVLLFGKEFYECKSQFSEFYFFIDQQDIVDFLVKSNFSNLYIIIKGSRGVALEKLVDYL